jgi:acetyltransferase-like isoleucine patch superfamily enzyme
MKLWKKIIVGMGHRIPSSKVKVLGYKMIGAKVGKHVKIRERSYIIANKITLQDGAVIGPDVHIVCDELFMGEETRIDTQTTVYGESRLEMRNGSYIGPRSWINCTAQVTLGRNSGCGYCLIFTHGVFLPYLEGYPRRFEEVIIEDNVWLPAGVTVLPGIRIGRGSMVGTGSLITRDIPPNVFAYGVPAEVVSDVSEMMEEMTPEKKRARLMEMMDDFSNSIIKEGGKVDRGQEPLALIVSRKKGMGFRKFGIFIFDKLVSRDDIVNLAGLSAGLKSSVFLSFGGFDEESKRLMRGSKVLYWIDLKERSCKRSWQKDYYRFRRFLARYYGDRFSLERGT